MCTVGWMVNLLDQHGVYSMSIINSCRVDVLECLRRAFKWSNVSQNTVYLTLGGGNGWNAQA